MNMEDVEPILRDACKFARGLLERLAMPKLPGGGQLAPVHRTALAINVNPIASNRLLR